MKVYSIMCDEQQRYEMEFERTVLVSVFKSKEDAKKELERLKDYQIDNENEDNWFRYYYVEERELIE